MTASPPLTKEIKRKILGENAIRCNAGQGRGKKPA